MNWSWSKIYSAMRFLLHTDADTTPLGAAFAAERATILLPWVVGVMAYLALLMVSTSMAIENTIVRWRSDLADRITVVVPPQIENIEATDQISSIDEVLNFLLKDASVVQAEEIPTKSLQKLIEPWLGTAAYTEGLPIPRLIKVEMRRVDNTNIDQLRERIEKKFPQVLLDDHRLWRTRLLAIGRILEGIAIAATIMSLATALVVIALGVQIAMSKHATTIQLLRVMGAEDTYITAQFMPTVRRAATIGNASAFIAFLATYALLRFFAQGFVPQRLGPYGWQWVTISIVPALLFCAALAVLVVTMRVRLLKTP